MNPFKPEYPTDPDLEGQVHDLLAPLASEAPAPDAAIETQHMIVEAAGRPMTSHGLGFRQRLLLGAAALITPLMAVTAVGAVAGNGSAVDALASVVGKGGANATLDESPTANDPTGTASATNSATGTTTGTATETATGTPTGTASPEGISTTSAVSPHENGHGCDDQLFANNPDGPPFGHHEKLDTPCTYGDDVATETATASATAEATETTEDAADPHSNGHGCDDKLFGDNPDGPPFGHHDTPVGPCKDGGTEGTATATASATAGAGTTDTGGQNGPGNSGNSKGNGKGKNK